MRLPKHKMAKIKAHKPEKRTSKHKNYKIASLPEKSENETDMQEENKPDTNEQNQDNEESNQEEEVDMDTQSAPGQLKLKSKEEKAAIRQLRHKSNAKHNHWKRKNSNISGKNGPRAINRASFN
jgi:hypothetical protein